MLYPSAYRQGSGIPPGCGPSLKFTGGRSLGGLGTTTGYHLASLQDANRRSGLSVVFLSVASKRPPATILHPSRMQITFESLETRSLQSCIGTVSETERSRSGRFLFGPLSRD